MFCISYCLFCINATLCALSAPRFRKKPRRGRVWPSVAWASWCLRSLPSCCWLCRSSTALTGATASRAATGKAAVWWWTRWTAATCAWAIGMTSARFFHQGCLLMTATPRGLYELWSEPAKGHLLSGRSLQSLSCPIFLFNHLSFFCFWAVEDN